MPAHRDHDLILFGATAFTGALTAEHRARHAPAKTRWALVGRSLAKLEAVQERLVAINPRCATLDLIEADSKEPASLRRLAASTRVLSSTVGRYIHFGEALVAACADAETDYLDLTGAPECVDLMGLRYHKRAKGSGARLVHCGGSDSIPHDLGVYFTVLQLPSDVPIRSCDKVKFSGEVSGGTYHPALATLGRVAQYAGVSRQRRERDRRPSDRRIGSLPPVIRRDTPSGNCLVPFRASIPRSSGVRRRRSAAALDRYGPDFRYGHFLEVKSARDMGLMVGGAGTLLAAAQVRPLREWLLTKKTQCEGPSLERRERSWFRVRVSAVACDQRLTTEVSGGDPGYGDPGYGETAKMLSESALSLAFDRLPKKCVQLTPTAAMGDALLKRLQRTGVSFKVLKG